MKKQELMRAYYLMKLARDFETRTAEQYTKGRIGGFCHLYSGEEAVAVGATWHLTPDDYVVGSYRDHAYYLVRGGDPGKAMAELFGHREGCCKGKGGSMHLYDREINFLGGYAIVGGECPIATGLGYAAKREGAGRVVLCSFGDGATNQGAFHEALNMASLYKLPVVWLCENNLYGIGTSVPRASAQKSMARKAGEAYNMPADVVDGMDFLKMQSVAERAVGRARAGEGPSFIEAKCYRYRGHSMSDPANYRSRAEVDVWKERDPLPRLKAIVKNDFEIGDEEFAEVDERVREELEKAVTFAEAGSELAVERLYEDLYAERVSAMAEISYREALNGALREEMQRDEKVVIFGEDVAEYEGSFKVTRGLLEEFGAERVFDTPISETGIVGLAIGAAMGGFRPVPELMTVNFAYVAMDQLLNHMALMRYMFGGQVTLPITVRMPGGGGHQLGSQHSHSLEVFFAHTPGLKVVYPATPVDAKALLKAAIRDDDPVIFLEHEGMYNSKGAVPESVEPAVIGEAAILREGSDATVVAYGGMTAVALQAAVQLAGESVNAEVVDLRTLRPWDKDTVAGSLAKTHRLVVVEEAPPVCGIGAEVVAGMCDLAFDELDAPPVRVSGADVPLPYAKELEQACIPHAPEVVAAVMRVLGR